MEDVMGKLTIVKFILHDLKRLLNSSTENTRTTVDAITTAKFAINQLLTLYYDSADCTNQSNLSIAVQPRNTQSFNEMKSFISTDTNAESSTRSSHRGVGSSMDHGADQDKKPVLPSYSENSEIHNFPKNFINEISNESTKHTNIFQTTLQRFFAKRKNFLIKQAPRISVYERDRKMTLESEPVGQLTPVKYSRNSSQNEKVPTQYILQENISRIVYSPVVYEAISQQATNAQLDLLKKCQLVKMEAIKAEQAICQEALENDVGAHKAIRDSEAVSQAMGILCLVKPEPSYSKNDADVTFENIAMARRKNGHPPLPLERPPWRWDKNVPSAKAEFIFWDSKNQCDVYACRTCFKKFNNGSARFWHERQIEVCSKEAHFPYYTSEYYIKQNSKSKHRR